MEDELRYEILDEDFNNNKGFSFMFSDGINYGESILNGDLSRTYFNGDNYTRTRKKDDKHNIIEVIISFYEKESNLTYYSLKEKNSEIIYKKNDSNNIIEVTKEEYESFAKRFIKKNNHTFDYLFRNLGISWLDGFNVLLTRSLKNGMMKAVK